MTQQTNGMPDLNYSEENFRELYEALKDLAACFRNIEVLSSLQNEYEKYLLGIAIDTMTKTLAKVEKK